MSEVRRYEIMSSLGVYCRGGLNRVTLDQGTVVVLASDYDALAARLEGQRDELNKLCVAHERIEADLMEQVAQLQARLTASEAAKKWTTEKPTVPGWYFYRRNGAVDVCRVAQFDIDENTFRHSRPCEWQGPFHPHEGPLTQGAL